MKIKTDSWHYRHYEQWEAWKLRTRPHYQRRTRPDLCHYVRVVLFWYWLRWPLQRRIFGFPPIMLLVSTVLAAGAVYGLFHVQDWASVGITVGLIAGSAVLIAVVSFLLFWAFSEKHLHTIVLESDTVQLGSAWVKAKKRHVCPIIERDGL